MQSLGGPCSAASCAGWARDKVFLSPKCPYHVLIASPRCPYFSLFCGPAARHQSLLRPCAFLKASLQQPPKEQIRKTHVLAVASRRARAAPAQQPTARGHPRAPARPRHGQSFCRVGWHPSIVISDARRPPLPWVTSKSPPADCTPSKHASLHTQPDHRDDRGKRPSGSDQCRCVAGA
ncbi:MAG: hypothetical protein J3K34DRAFT_19790 [Monoraphidium minutum]|nr:MAG: hypothetical protein J3K34DRAFT_19790 [Monoraphidium minutum]